MGLTSTRTHTVYWGEESVATLKAEAKKLWDDFQQRSRYIDAVACLAMTQRLTMLDAAIAMLTDRAD